MPPLELAGEVLDASSWAEVTAEMAAGAILGEYGVGALLSSRGVVLRCVGGVRVVVVGTIPRLEFSVAEPLELGGWPVRACVEV